MQLHCFKEPPQIQPLNEWQYATVLHKERDEMEKDCVLPSILEGSVECLSELITKFMNP